MGRFFSSSFLGITISSFLISQSLTAETCGAKSDIKQTSEKILECVKPECFSNEGFQDKSKTPEEILSAKLSIVSADEAVNRLIFSEMLASSCIDSLSDENLKNMAKGIALVIHQRTKKMKQNTPDSSKEKAVVFEKAQFRSSTGSCDVARRAEFLCPSKHFKWEKLWKMAQDSWQEVKEQNNSNIKAQFYYFPKHFDDSKDCAKYKNPEVYQKWKVGKTEVPVLLPGKELSACVRFFQ